MEDFEKFGCNYWKTWADENGKLVLDYGNAWFDFNGVDQIAALRKALKTNPTDRRMIVSAWRPDRLDRFVTALLSLLLPVLRPQRPLPGYGMDSGAQ